MCNNNKITSWRADVSAPHRSVMIPLCPFAFSHLLISSTLELWHKLVSADTGVLDTSLMVSEAKRHIHKMTWLHMMVLGRLNLTRIERFIRSPVVLCEIHLRERKSEAASKMNMSTCNILCATLQCFFFYPTDWSWRGGTSVIFHTTNSVRHTLMNHSQQIHE